MPPPGIVPAFDEIKHRHLALRHRVVVGVAHRGHGPADADLLTPPAELDRGGLTALIGVMNHRRAGWRLVLNLYGVTPEERQRVWETLNIIRGVKAVTDLVPMPVAAARA